jgi:FkbM family methyltransferase
VMVDAGANIGLFALTGARQGAEVHAFEPIPANFIALERNVELNRGARVHAVPAALGAETGTASFGIPTERGSGEQMSAFFTLGGSHRQIQAPVIRLDDYLDEHGVERVRLAKVDVEGAETLVFRGASRALELQQIDLILFEASIYTLVPHGFTLKELLATLTDAGYLLFRLTSFGPLPRYRYDGEPDLPDREDRTPGLVGIVRMGIEDRTRHLNLVAVRGTHPAVREHGRRLRTAAL